MLTPPQTSYMKWLALPINDRVITKRAFAELIGVHEQALQQWQDKVEFKSQLKRFKEAAENSDDYAAWCMREHAKWDTWTKYTKLSSKERLAPADHRELRNYQKQIMDMTAGAKQGDGITFVDMTDEEVLTTLLGYEYLPEWLTMDEVLDVKREMSPKRAETNVLAELCVEAKAEGRTLGERRRKR